MSVAALCRDAVTLERQTITQDAGGGTRRAEPWIPLKVNVRADVQPVSSNTSMRYERRSISVSHTVYFSEDVGATEQDRIRIVGSNPIRYLLVQGYRDASAGRGVCWAADCEESTGEH